MRTKTSVLVLAAMLLTISAVAEDPVFPYGAVYFRKSNPPAEDWAKDHAYAAKVGVNNFRHWVMWSAIEVAPDKYDWADYDRMLDLAAQNGIKVTLAEMITAAPEWMFDKYAHAMYKASDDSLVHSSVGGSSATGGFPGLCLDNEDVKGRAEIFLTKLIERYRDHKAMWAWDTWNEHSYPGGGPPKMLCYCDATQKKFREWLQKKYGSLENLGKAWYRHSFASWDNVHPPRSFSGYPDSLDWMEFRVDNQYRLHQWRVDLLKKLDQRNKRTAHGVASTLEALPTSANNEWRSAEQVDVWGFTWVASRKGSELWKQFHAVDLVRAGSRGKPFWHAEAQAGPLWMQPQVIGRQREDGRISEAEDVRLWNMVSMAGGATGILYPRWRPLLDGPLFGAFGPMGMDGTPTPRSDMAGKVARWANGQPELWKSRPVKGDIGIVFVPEAEVFNFVQQGSTKHYAESIRGAYQAFFDNNIQADFVHIDDIGQYGAVYLPYPIHLKTETAKKLADYVRGGRTLISEGLPGYFGEHGKVGTVQPNYGLDAVFGAKEAYVEFTPDLLDKLTLTVLDRPVGGRFFMQAYAAAGGKAAGAYGGGKVAAVENTVGKGRTLLIGTHPGASYFLNHSAQTKAFFAYLLEWAKQRQVVKSSDGQVRARLHRGAGGDYIWAVNATREAKPVTITVTGDEFKVLRKASDLWEPKTVVKVTGNAVSLTVPERTVAVLKLER